MLENIFMLLLLETVQPSFGTFVSVVPEAILASSQAQANVLGLALFAPPDLAESKAPIKIGESIAPVIEARSVYAIDLATGTPLFVRDIFTRRPIASVAKLVTAMVILDSHDISEVLTVSKGAVSQEGSRMWLQEGETITVEATLKGLLVNSGNDAAYALAQFDSGSSAAFIEKMNAKALSLGLRDTHFSNVMGFDERDNYSTAFDTMLFSRAALAYPTILQTVSIQKGEVTSVNGKIRHILESTNELLLSPYFKIRGLKTGRTPRAGQTFVALAELNGGHEVLTIVLDSPNRFKETTILLDWIVRNFTFP